MSRAAKGDATGDGMVNLTNLNVLKATYASMTPYDDADCRCDFEHDGAISLAYLFCHRS